MSRPVRDPAAWLGLGTAIAVLIGLSAVLFLTRTERGRAEILAYTVATIGGSLNGTLRVDRLDGNLFTGAKLYEVSITGDDDELLMSADSAYIDYDLATFVGGDVVINRLVLFQPALRLWKLPVDSLWNYQQILSDTTSGPDEAPGRATLVERLELVEADVLIRSPWEPDDDLTSDERRREIEAALSDTSRLVVERASGGYVRTMRLELAGAALSSVFVGPDERGGTYAELESARGAVYAWADPPLVLSEISGKLNLRDGIVRYEVPGAVIGESRVSTGGVIDLTGEEPRYDFVVDGGRVRLEDLRWLYPPIPDNGTAAGRLSVETRPEGLFILARDARLALPDTRIAGSVGVVLGDTVRFVDVDLHADPLNVATVQRMIPAGEPIEGLRIGSAEIRGGR